MAGIASPRRFFDDLEGNGWRLAEAVSFRDHHRYTAGDLGRVMAIARQHGAATVLTTEKDFVRLLPYRPFELPVLPVRLVVEPVPVDRFRAWLLSQIASARGDSATEGCVRAPRHA
jgi:tetraacyldisaccharide 4'-kinase